MRIMGLDLGESRIGVALSDELLLTAQGLCVINSRGSANDLAQVLQLIEQHAVTHVVLGLPRNMDGSSGPMVDKVKAFGRQLAERKPELVLEYWDERLTTTAAQRVLVDADMSRSRRRKVVDKVAASLILQGYMDLRARRESSLPSGSGIDRGPFMVYD
jgi:putative Holliday junction resolvase